MEELAAPEYAVAEEMVRYRRADAHQQLVQGADVRDGLGAGLDSVRRRQGGEGAQEQDSEGEAGQALGAGALTLAG